jgi:murein tripeptide amidase MpaA
MKFQNLNYLAGLLFYIISILLDKINSTNVDFSYYHKTSQIDQIMKDLQHSCTRLKITEISAINFFPNLTEKEKQEYRLLKYYDITSRDILLAQSQNITKQNVFLLAGEHPRELISSELLLNFIMALCNSNPLDQSKLGTSITNIINTFNFRVIINANPNGRDLVEKGQYCRRSNLNNVDINRNWDIFWSKHTSFSIEENPGRKPFSEIETQFTLNSIKNFNAKLFLTIHSGVYGLYLPYAYLEQEGNLNFLFTR